jgi:hypothetical protein
MKSPSKAQPLSIRLSNGCKGTAVPVARADNMSLASADELRFLWNDEFPV